MKAYGFHIIPNAIQYNSSIRDKVSIIKLLIEVTRVLILSKPTDLSDLPGVLPEGKIRLIIYIDKMSRVIICENDKIHTFNFPFSLKIEDEHFGIYFYGYEISNAVCSILATVFYDICDDTSMESILEKYWDVVKEAQLDADEKEICDKLITYLFSFESGYIRYDHDVKEPDPILHPLDHLDFNYTGGVTLKIGLNKAIDYQELINIMDINTMCSYLS